MKQKICYEQVQDFCIPHLRACDGQGNEYPVVTTIQANYEWYTEYREKLFYKRLSIIELVVVAFILAMIFIKCN